jgi:hypothetical protein
VFHVAWVAGGVFQHVVNESAVVSGHTDMSYQQVEPDESCDQLKNTDRNVLSEIIYTLGPQLSSVEIRQPSRMLTGDRWFNSLVNPQFHLF